MTQGSMANQWKWQQGVTLSTVADNFVMSVLIWTSMAKMESNSWSKCEVS